MEIFGIGRQETDLANRIKRDILSEQLHGNNMNDDYNSANRIARLNDQFHITNDPHTPLLLQDGRAEMRATSDAHAQLREDVRSWGHMNFAQRAIVQEELRHMGFPNINLNIRNEFILEKALAMNAREIDPTQSLTMDILPHFEVTGTGLHTGYTNDSLRVVDTNASERRALARAGYDSVGDPLRHGPVRHDAGVVHSNPGRLDGGHVARAAGRGVESPEHSTARVQPVAPRASAGRVEQAHTVRPTGIVHRQETAPEAGQSHRGATHQM